MHVLSVEVIGDEILLQCGGMRAGFGAKELKVRSGLKTELEQQ